MAKKKFNPLDILLVVIIVYLLGEIFLATYYYCEAHSQVKNTEKQIVVLEQENEKAKEEIRELQTQFMIEKFARENLGLAKNGETIIYFKNSLPKVNETQQVKNNFFQKLIENLLKLFKK